MKKVELHSSIVGGSTASRVIACPGSVALVAQMPPKPSSKYADEGTMLHGIMADLLSDDDRSPEDFLGMDYLGIPFTHELLDEKILPALRAFNEIDPDLTMDIEVEARVDFGDYIPGAFGSADVVGRRRDRAYIIDWKFGSGVTVEAENNQQLLFYAAAARRSVTTAWAFKDAKDVELIIVQPPEVRRWVTDMATLDRFEAELARAVRLARQADAPLATGDHCRWCAAKPVCPKMTGVAERVLQSRLKTLDNAAIGRLLVQADLVEDWIKELRELAFTMLEEGVPVPGYKLVAKRATRQWVDPAKAEETLRGLGIGEDELYKRDLVSPAQAEKVLKKSKLALPDDLVAAVSSGSTLAPESDPRPAVLQIGRQLTAALSKLQ